MIDRTFVAEEQSILNRLREQEAKLDGNCACYQLFLNFKNKYYMYTFGFSWDYKFFDFIYLFLFHISCDRFYILEHVYFKLLYLKQISFKKCMFSISYTLL